MTTTILERPAFHYAEDVSKLAMDLRARFTTDTRFEYRFDNFFHPFVAELIARLNRESLEGLLDPEWQKSLATPDPKTSAVVATSTGARRRSGSSGGPFARYVGAPV